MGDGERNGWWMVAGCPLHGDATADGGWWYPDVTAGRQVPADAREGQDG